MSVATLRRAAVLAVAAATLAVTGQASAQAAAWEGTFKGGFVSDGPTGNLTLTFKKDAGAWKVSATIESDQAPPPAGDPRDLKFEGETFKFSQLYGDLDVLFQGTRTGDTIKGTLEAYQGGNLIGSGTFEIKKT